MLCHAVWLPNLTMRHVLCCAVQVMSLQRLKEILTPKLDKAPPPEMMPFQPEPDEPIKVSSTQVSRRVAQCDATGIHLLDLALAPRLTKGDFGVIYQVGAYNWDNSNISA